MVAKRLGLALATLAMAACHSPPGLGSAATDVAKATLSGEACPDIGERAYFFWMEPLSAEPGDEIALFPYWTDMPGGYNDLPPGCLDGLGVFPEGAATFRRQEDGLAIATISPDLAPGTRVRLEGNYRGYALNGPVDIYAKAANPLVGMWRQDGSDCPDGTAIQELVFSGGGEFSVTWTPFEVYKDYWGSYAYDPETGAIRLEIESGNQVPDDVVTEGTVTLDEGMMTFDTLYFGTPMDAEDGCRAGFPR